MLFLKKFQIPLGVGMESGEDFPSIIASGFELLFSSHQIRLRIILLIHGCSRCCEL